MSSVIAFVMFSHLKVIYISLICNWNIIPEFLLMCSTSLQE